MPRISSIVFLLLFLLIAAACRVRPEPLGAFTVPVVATDSASVRLSQRLDDFMQTLAPHSFNGALLVEKNGKLVLAKGYGRSRAEEGQAFELNSISNTAFFAQQVTAVAILSLQEQGSLQLSDSLSRFFENLPADKQGISLQHLLSHTAGFSDGAALADALDKQQFLEQLWQQPLQFAPGTDYHFSGAGYRLLAAVVEAVSGQSYEAFVRQRLLEPAGMLSTGYVLPDFEEMSPALSRSLSPDDLPLQNYRALYPALWQQLGSRGMLSSAADLYRWQQMLFRGGLLQPEVLSQLWENRKGVPEERTAFGWVVQESPGGKPMLIHNSHADGYACQLLYDQHEEVLIVMLSNQYNRQVGALGNQLLNMLYQPYYAPAPLPYSEDNFMRLPQGPEAEHLRALMQLVVSAQDEISPGFIETHFSPAFRKNVPDQMHMRALRQMQQRLSGARLIRSERNWPYYTLTYFVPEGGLTYLLRIGVEPSAPYRISSLELQLTDSL